MIYYKIYFGIGGI